MKVYLIKTTKSETSHNWGGEFYFNKDEAEDRASYLEELLEDETKFIVVPAELIESENNIVTSFGLEDVYACIKNSEGIKATEEQAKEVLRLAKSILDTWETTYDLIEEAVSQYFNN